MDRERLDFSELLQAFSLLQSHNTHDCLHHRQVWVALKRFAAVQVESGVDGGVEGGVGGEEEWCRECYWKSPSKSSETCMFVGDACRLRAEILHGKDGGSTQI